MHSDRNSVATLDVATPTRIDLQHASTEGSQPEETNANGFTVEQYARL
jgi:hypothetical protein